MAERRFFERLLIVAGIFFLFFVITMIGLPLVLYGLGGDSSSREGLLLLGALQALVLFIAPSLVSARIISPRPFAYLRLDKAPGLFPLLGVVMGYLIALPALNQIIFWNQNLVFPDFLAPWGETLREMEDSANAASAVMLDVQSVGGMLINLLVIGLVTAFGEEMFFRGALQTTAASSGSPHTAIWVVALFFSAMHFQIFGFVPRLLIGAWFGYLLFWTRSLYVPVFAHFFNNGLVVVFAWLNVAYGFSLDNIGVVEYGFPMPAFVSAVATVVFLVYFRRFFFMPHSQDSVYA